MREGVSMRFDADDTLYWGPELRKLMKDSEFMAQFPDGVSSSEMYHELMERGTNVATSATVIDVADYMNEIYGRPS